MGTSIHGTKVFENDDLAVYEFEVPEGETKGIVALAKSDRTRFLTAPDAGLDEIATRIVRKAHRVADESGSWPTHVRWTS